jgi:hypothetical protein
VIRIHLTTIGAAGVVLLLLAGCAGLGGGSRASRQTDGGEIVASGDVGAFELQTGDCIISGQIAADEVFSDVKAVPCTEAHDSQVVGTYNVIGDDLDEDAIYAEAETRCSQIMESYVGPGWWDEENLTFSFFYPTTESWADGDREVACLAETIDGSLSLTESLAGALP